MLRAHRRRETRPRTYLAQPKLIRASATFAIGNPNDSASRTGWQLAEIPKMLDAYTRVTLSFGLTYGQARINLRTCAR
jgi:hypothetical protein